MDLGFLEGILFLNITETDHSYLIHKSCSNHLQFYILIPQCQAMNPFLSQTYRYKNKKSIPIPLTLGKKMYTYPTNSEKIHFTSFILPCNLQERKDLVTVIMKKNTNLDKKNSEKHMISSFFH